MTIKMDTGCLEPQAPKGLVGGDGSSPLCVSWFRCLAWGLFRPWVFEDGGATLGHRRTLGNGAGSTWRMLVDVALTGPGCSSYTICACLAGPQAC